jgi:hypothetical protein
MEPGDPTQVRGESEDLGLLLTALHQGLLNPGQIQACFQEHEQRTGGSSPPTLIRLALEKGYLSQEQVRKLAADASRAGPGATLAMVEVSLECAACGATTTLPLNRALARPRCPKCSGSLHPRGSKATASAPASSGASLPAEVRTAAQNPKNRFARYVLLDKLGMGGMGEVFKAWDTVLGRPVALKFPRWVGEEEIRRLYAEARGAGSLTHPNVAAIYEFAQAEGRHYIAMQFIDGTTAERRLQAMGAKRDVREIVRWIRDAALGAHYAHQHGVVHRDLKPQNLMIDHEGHLYVMDFGLAKVLSTEGDATVSGMVLGTPAFMPPEQAAGRVKEIGPASDVYSLGATLYVFLSGKRPHEGTSVSEILVNILTTDVPPLRQVDPSLPWELEAIVDKAMRREKEQRYATAQELADDLTRFLTDQPVLARGATLSYRLSKKVKRHRAVLLTVAICLAAATAAVWALTRGRTKGPPPVPPGAARAAHWNALLADLRRAVSIESFDAEAAGPLLSRARKEFPERQAELDELIQGQHRLIRTYLENLSRARWLESRSTVGAHRDWLAFMNLDTTLAQRILDFRGTCTILIQIHPYAEVRGPWVEPLAPEDRFTPLALKDVEILPAALELSHPTYGMKVVALEGLQNGKSYVVEGRWEQPDSIRQRQGP